MSGISKRVSGSWVSGDYGIMKTATDTITTLPAVIYANDTTATVGLKGNMEQSGTPTPSNPIQPSECGVRTENMFDKNATNTSNGYADNYRLNSGVPDVAVGNFITEYIAVEPSETYTISGFTAGWSSSVSWYDSNYTLIGYKLYENRSATSFTVPNNAKYIRFTGDMSKKDIAMLNTGSTALPYEPYGYKIPISSASTTTPVYLGEVESTRLIRELVLTGDEDWTAGGGNSRYIISVNNIQNYAICSHFAFGDSLEQNEFDVVPNRLQIRFNNAGYTTLEAWQTYLQQQYAAGTPVCVWYALAEPTTGIVNEPIRKIGDYADTVSGISIPTISGANSFDVLTTLKPSEVSLSYTGWRDATVNEKSDNLFDYNNPLDKIDNVYISVNGTIEASTFYYTCKIQAIENGTYTYRFTESEVFTSPTVGFYDSSDTLLSVAQHNANVSYFSFITPVNCAYMRVSIFKRTEQEAMLNSGSTALPYEPYWK